MVALNNIENYGLSFQIKVLSVLLTDNVFLQNISDVLDEDIFPNQAHKWIVGEILKYYNKFHNTISMEVLKIELKKLENEILQLSIKEQLKEAYQNSESSDLEYIKNEFSNFCKNQLMKKTLLESIDLLKIGDYDAIWGKVSKTLKSGQDKNIGMLYEKDIDYRYRENNRTPIEFPWKTFNKITQGGYGKGDLVLLFGSPGGGKSWGIIAMAAEAAKQGFNIIFYALELGEDYVGKRFDSYFTGIPVDQIHKHKHKVEEIMSTIPGRIIIKGYPPKRVSLTTIEKHIKQTEYQESTENEKFKVHGIFIDYLDLLKNRNRNRSERKDDIDDVYTDAKGLAKELDIPIVSPSQANRSGAEADILEGTHIAGSYDKLMIGDIVISLARGRKDKINGTGRWHFMKNRYGPDGVTYSSKIDTSKGHIEIDEEALDDDSINQNKGNGNEVNSDQKEFLRKKFLELEL